MVAPQTGESCWLEFSHLDAIYFQIFLEPLASEYPDNLNVVQLDNGRFHHSNNLKIPDKILLIFQPLYSPELNPIERVGQHIQHILSLLHPRNRVSFSSRIITDSVQETRFLAL